MRTAQSSKLTLGALVDDERTIHYILLRAKLARRFGDELQQGLLLMRWQMHGCTGGAGYPNEMRANYAIYATELH